MFLALIIFYYIMYLNPPHHMILLWEKKSQNPSPGFSHFIYDILERCSFALGVYRIETKTIGKTITKISFDRYGTVQITEEAAKILLRKDSYLSRIWYLSRVIKSC